MVPLLEAELGNVMTGSQSRPAEELFTALRKGSKLRKYGRRGKPKDHYFRLSPDDRELQWESSNGKVRSIPLAVVTRVLAGQVTPVFRRDPLPEYASVSFSLVYLERGGKERSLDVICKSKGEFETWFWGIKLVISMVQNLAQGPLTRPGLAPTATIRRRSHMQSDDNLAKLESMAASLQPPKPVMGGGQVQGRVSGVLGFPVKREIGDCYIWGSWGEGEPGERGCPLQSSSNPTMVYNTHALDVTQVACGSRHAALVTRGGEVYTWGSGHDGALGHGTTSSAAAPVRVQRLYGTGAAVVGCGHTYSAALLADGGVLMWGTGLGGQLGLGPTLHAVTPTRVCAGLEGVRLHKISCGPFHCAAISAEGVLFTWGDGLFGKLGHGSHEGVSRPQPVAALADHWVLSVSCGWWHTAAAGVARASLPRVSTASIDSTSTMSTQGGRSDLAAPTGVGGALFTWGGDFTWEEPGVKSQGRRDHHRGCLGHGDLLGRLVPTMVSGEDDIKQVACGLNFTVALTTNGQVLQMGSTGNNSSEHNALWEGARVPVLVGGALAPVAADSIACGTSHVAVVARVRGHGADSRRSSGGGLSEGSGGQRMRLLTWGKGGAGQLGLPHDPRSRETRDHSLPQVVTALEGRRILHLACGGNYTLAVCEHDPREAAARSSRELDPFISDPRANGGSVTPSGHRGVPRATTAPIMAHMGSTNVSASSSSVTTNSSVRASVPPGSTQGDNAPNLGRRSDRGSRGGAPEPRALTNSKSMERGGAATATAAAAAARSVGAASGSLGSFTNSHSASDPNMVSLQQLASVSTKRSRLATSFKSLRGSRSPSRKEMEGPARTLATRSTGQATSFRPPSAPRSEPDLGRVSTSSSITTTSMGLATPAASYSIADADDGSSKGSTPAGDKYDYGRQLRYWQERAANMEQQLSRKTRESETLQHELQQLQQQRRIGGTLISNMSSSSFMSADSHGTEGLGSRAGGGSYPVTPVPSPQHRELGVVALTARTVSDGGVGSPNGLARGVSLGAWAERGSRAFTSEGGAPSSSGGGRGSSGGGAAPGDAAAAGEASAEPSSPFALASRLGRSSERQGSMGFAFLRSNGEPGRSGGDAEPRRSSTDDTRDAVGSSGGGAAAQSSSGPRSPTTRSVRFSGGGLSRARSDEGVASPSVVSELAAELEALRLRNQILEEQLEQARLAAQERQASLQLQERLEASRSAGISGRTLPAGAPTRSASTAGGHRRINSFDMGNLVAHPTKEVEPGVFLSLAPHEGGGFDLKRVRFDKQVFTTEEASRWWAANRERLMAAHNIVAAAPMRLAQPSPPPQQPQQEQQQEQQGQQAGGLGEPGVQAQPASGIGRLALDRLGERLGDSAMSHSSPAGSMFEVDLVRLLDVRNTPTSSSDREAQGPAAGPPNSGGQGQGASPAAAGDGGSRQPEQQQGGDGSGGAAVSSPTHGGKGHRRTPSALMRLFGNGSA